MKKFKFLSLLSASLLLAACANDTTEEAPAEETEQVEETTEDTSTEEETTEEAEDTADATLEGNILKFGYGAPHGDKSFGVTFVGLEGDTITHAFIDEFQFMDEGDWTGVPSSDGAFAEGYADGKILASKVENDEAYSNMMAENAGSTVSLGENYKAITDFAVGKTVAELEESITELEGLGEDGSVADVVSGATLVDTAGYLQGIVDVANDGFGIEASGEINGAEFGYTLQAPHGDKAFAIAGVLHDGDTVLAAVQDEFQFMDEGDWTGVPNSDGAFAEGYADGKVLVSKHENNDAYSSMMAENAGSTVSYADNNEAINTFAIGKSFTEIEDAISELEGLGEDGSVADVVSGATFVDTAGYLNSFVEAGK